MDIRGLFNLNKDPGDTRNLFYTGAHNDIIANMKAKIHAWQERLEDNVAI